MARTDLSYANIATEQNQFERLGHPGRIFNVYKYSDWGYHFLLPVSLAEIIY